MILSCQHPLSGVYEVQVSDPAHSMPANDGHEITSNCHVLQACKLSQHADEN